MRTFICTRNFGLGGLEPGTGTFRRVVAYLLTQGMEPDRLGCKDCTNHQQGDTVMSRLAVEQARTAVEKLEMPDRE